MLQALGALFWNFKFSLRIYRFMFRLGLLGGESGYLYGTKKGHEFTLGGIAFFVFLWMLVLLDLL